MSDKFEMSTGQAHEVAMALGRNGWTNEEVKRISEGSYPRRCSPGTSRACVHHDDGARHQLRRRPLLPNGWKVEEHQKGGQFKFDARRCSSSSPRARRTASLEGNKLRKELAGKPVLNANVLDYLLANPQLIPEEWKGKDVHLLLGHDLPRLGGNLYVRYLYWRGDGWATGDSRWLDIDWGGSDPAACVQVRT